MLIDTSAWISFFRSVEAPASQIVADLIETDRAVLTGPVLAELLQGLRGEGEARRLRSLFLGLAYVEVERNDWHTAGTTLQTLRRRGITIPLTDALIGTIASRHGFAVLTLDQHFGYLPVERYPL